MAVGIAAGVVEVVRIAVDVAVGVAAGVTLGGFIFEDAWAWNTRDGHVAVCFPLHLSLLQIVNSLWRFEQCSAFRLQLLAFGFFFAFAKESTFCGSNCENFPRHDVAQREGT